MAIKSVFPDDTGFVLFSEWSATADCHDARATRSTWRSVKETGGVGIGTLLFLAKEHGFVLPKADKAAAKPDPKVLASRERARAAKSQAKQVLLESNNARAAGEAAAQWEQASETGISPYLIRKGVQAYGVRFTADGYLLVPMRDGGGTLWSVQSIAPIKPQEGSDKSFLLGSRKSGLWHMLGTPEGAVALLVAEGYATAASLHQATDYPVAVAFDRGNLLHVAKALQRLYPAALLVLCGDNDVQTHARTGRNPGRDKATAVAKAVQGIAVLPSEKLLKGGSDFNDLHQHIGGDAGLAAVRDAVQVAIDSHQAKRPQPRSVSPAMSPIAAAALDAFNVEPSGVWFIGVEQDGKRKSPEWVCSRLDVPALTRDQDGCGWGYLLAFADPLGCSKQWAMPARMLSGDGGEYRAMLLNMGLRISVSPRARNLLTQYIQTRQPEAFATCTDRVGWHGHAFVLPHETIGDGAERIVFQTDNAVENTFRSKGTADAWRERVGTLCAGNSRLVFAVACAFAGPLLRSAGVESGGFHFRGDSSSGKTTALKVAASVYGGASFLQRWRTTDNALEAIAAQHSDCLLILDELAQVDPKTAGECAYMLANEQSKARATRTGAARARRGWRLLFLSAGEVGLADHMAEGMKRTRTGQEVRMADIPADAGVGFGAFETLHGLENGSAYSRHMVSQAESIFGAVGIAWFKWLTKNSESLKDQTHELSSQLARQFIPKASSGQVERVGARFALVGAAGEMATAAGLTGWSPGESEHAARACFNGWLESRGGAGNGEVVAILRQVRRFVETHGEGRFTWWHRGSNEQNTKTLNRAGFRRLTKAKGKPIKTDNDELHSLGSYACEGNPSDDAYVEFFVLPEVFRSEVCAGFDYKNVARVLRDHGCLVPGNGRSFDTRQRLPGLGVGYCYRITATLFTLDL